MYNILFRLIRLLSMEATLLYSLFQPLSVEFNYWVKEFATGRAYCFHQLLISFSKSYVTELNKYEVTTRFVALGQNGERFILHTPKPFSDSKWQMIAVV